MREVSFLDAVAVLDYEPLTGQFKWKPNDRPQWNAQFAGKPAGFLEPKTGYIRLRVGGRKFQAGRVAWLLAHGHWPRLIDHINGDRADNRLSNLREATHAQNVSNVKRHKDNRSGFKGVSYNRRIKRWYAQIGFQGRHRYLGAYPTPEQAHAAYCKAATMLHGEFARTE